MSNAVDEKILQLLGNADFMTLCTCAGGNPSGANVYFANDGFELYFFTFNPSRKAEQIRVNPQVQCVVRPDGTEGIRELQIDGRAERVKDPAEIEKARRLVLSVTEAFKGYMDDEFLVKNNVVGYYKIKPLTIKYVDFYGNPQFEWREFPENSKAAVKSALESSLATALLHVRAVRAPFFTATVVPVMLGSAVAYFQFGQLSWSVFWWSLLGVLLAQAGTNVSNDYSDHLTRNDESNKLFSPFNGGSRMIQAGLMRPEKLLAMATLFFLGTVFVGLHLNELLHGAYLAPSPVLWTGMIGLGLGIFYTAGPRLSYRGWGDFAVMLGFGPITILGAHYVQKQALLPAEHWDPTPALLASIPIALLVALILFINGFQDFEADRGVGKRTWVVRTAEGGERADYRRPFEIYTWALSGAFLVIFLLGGFGVLNGETSTPWVWMALLPVFLAYKAIRDGNRWIARWETADANVSRLPYELLPVNAMTIAIHLSVGLLLTLAFFVGGGST